MKNTTVILQSVATTVLSPVHTSNMSNATSCLLLRHVACCRLTCRSNVRHVEATFDMSKQHVERCFDMLPVAVRHVAGVDGVLQRCCFHQFAWLNNHKIMINKTINQQLWIFYIRRVLFQFQRHIMYNSKDPVVCTVLSHGTLPSNFVDRHM